MHNSPWQLVVWLALIGPCYALPAAELDYVRDVRPILQQHCYACHAAEKQKSGLRLDIKSEAFKGGDGYGASLVAGQPQASPIIELITAEDLDQRMPPAGPGLSQSEIETLRQWIQQGAKWPDGVDLAQLADRLDHWSFQPLATSDVLVPPASEWGTQPIDAFVWQRLQHAGLQPSSEASREQWLRRVYFDLTGLPPSPEDVQAFCADRSPDAHERVVDRLLSSPRYGEHWGQHWLDVVRYADTHGFEVNTERPNAWPYRDYVIDAFNNDTPFDQFVREQLAGDCWGEDAATGFLVTAAVLLPGQIGKDAESMRLARQDSLAEILINTGETFLGLSLGCARCHDHKFDPISQQDYYSMQAFVSGVQYGERPLHAEAFAQAQARAKPWQERLHAIDQQLAELAAKAADSPERQPPTRADLNVKAFEPVDGRFIRFTIHDANRHPTLGLIEPCIDEFEIFTTDAADGNLALRVETRVTASGSRTSAIHRLEHVRDGKYGNSHSWMSDEAGRGWLLFELPEIASIQRVVWSRDREGTYTDRLATAYTLEIGPELDAMQRVAHQAPPPGNPLVERLQREKADLEAKLSHVLTQPMVYAGHFTTPEPTHLLRRGDPEQPAEEVPPRTLPALGELQLPLDAGDQQRRQALAEWLVRPDNPLTARVMVNRIWQWHFGIGIVETASDFGRNGALPTHPELLDWLAAEFQRSQWSIKHMHRLLVLSATYRQASQVDPLAQAIDAQSRLLWRFPPRRIEAEAIRDSMLATSGRLRLEMGGPGFDLFKSRGGLNGFPPIESFEPAGRRRMIYAHKVRMEREAVFGAFDCPDAGQSTARRRQSTTPIQALNLLNSQFTIDEAEAMARRLAMEVPDSAPARVERAYQLALGRAPRAEEVGEAVDFVEAYGLPALCRVLFNSNEFLFLP